jgi:hypothetical protein
MKWVATISLFMLLTACIFEPKPVIEHQEVQVQCPISNKNTWFLDRYSVDVTYNKIKC